MVPRSDGRYAQKRRIDDHPPWVTEDNTMDPSPTATQDAIPTNDSDDNDDDNDDEHNHGRPFSVTWGQKPTSIPSGAPLWLSSFLAVPDVTATEIASSPTSVPEQYIYTSIVEATVWASDGPPEIIATQFPSPGPATESGPTDSVEGKHQTKQVALYTAAGVVPALVLSIIGFIIFFCLRKRRKQKQISEVQAQIEEKAKFEQPTIQAYRAPVEPVPVPVSSSPWYTSASDNPPVITPIITSPSPVILGPISAGSNSNYMTGIDTSDVLSTRNERTGLGDPFADGSSLLEEPPPPYKPRSSISGSNSIRMHRSSLSRSSQTSAPSYATRAQSIRNPFEDPREDDDAVSQLSNSTLNRNHENMSVVSDLSYQQDPHVGRGVS